MFWGLGWLGIRVLGLGFRVRAQELWEMECLCHHVGFRALLGH